MLNGMNGKHLFSLGILLYNLLSFVSTKERSKEKLSGVKDKF